MRKKVIVENRTIFISYLNDNSLFIEFFFAKKILNLQNLNSNRILATYLSVF